MIGFQLQSSNSKLSSLPLYLFYSIMPLNYHPASTGGTIQHKLLLHHWFIPSSKSSPPFWHFLLSFCPRLHKHYTYVKIQMMSQSSSRTLKNDRLRVYLLPFLTILSEFCLHHFKMKFYALIIYEVSVCLQAPFWGKKGIFLVK